MSAPGTNYDLKQRVRLDPHDLAAAAPKSRPRAVRAYWWDMEQVRANRGTPEYREQRNSAESLYAASRASARAIGWKAVIRSTCITCVGGDPDHPKKQYYKGSLDLAPRKQVKNCQCTDCPLHRLREWRVSETLRLVKKGGQMGSKHRFAVVPDYC